MKCKKFSSKAAILGCVFLICVAAFTLPAKAATDDKIVFLHHSTGWGVYLVGGVETWLENYNSTHGSLYDISERSYPNLPYPWDNYPYDYWNLWVNGQCNSDNPNIECLSTLTAANDIIVWKHCFPGASVLADTGNPDVTSSTRSLENYKLQYRALRTAMDAYPNTKFVVWTLAPLHRLATNAEDAARAKQFVDWVKNVWLTENGSHPNIFVFDFWGQVAGSDNFLKLEYEISSTGSDSHPNSAANTAVGPVFSQFVVDTAEVSLPSVGDVVAPSAPSGLSVL